MKSDSCFDSRKNGAKFKSCRRCLARIREYNMRPDRVQSRKAYNARPEVVERLRKAHDTDEYRQQCFEYRHSDAGKEQSRLQNRKPKSKMNKKRYDASQKGLAAKERKIQKRRDDPAAKLQNVVGIKMRKMLKGERTESVTLSKYSNLSTGESLRAHLESLFEPGMSFENYGYGPDKWNVGHRIARAMYTETTDDMKRCWHSKNLFPQWQNQNFALKAKLPPDEELLRFQDIWPNRWLHLPTSDERVMYERECSRWA